MNTDNLWRVWLVRNGSIYPPMTGALDHPFTQGQPATCLWETHEAPDPDCHCGWRAATTLAAVRDAYLALTDSAYGNLPTVRRYEADHPPKPERWTWPRPVITQVTLTGAIDGTTPFNTNPRLRAKADAHFQKRGESIIEEGNGMYRGATLTVDRAWITGTTEGTHRYAYPRDLLTLERNLGCRVTQLTGDPRREFDQLMEREDTA